MGMFDEEPEPQVPGLTMSHYIDHAGIPRAKRDDRPIIRTPCPDRWGMDDGPTPWCVEGRIPGVRKGTTKNCPTCKGAGETWKAYSRVTSYIAGLEDDTNVHRWRVRNLLRGIVQDPAATLETLRAVDWSTFEERDTKRYLNDLADRLMVVGGVEVAADRGTHIHELTEYADRGEPVPDHTYVPSKDMRIDVTLQDRADVAAYRRVVDAWGWEILAIEKFVICDELAVAGTADRILKWPGETPCPECDLPWVGDLKGLALDTPLPTPAGWTTMAAVQLGDQVLGSDGKPCNVTAKSATKRIGAYIVKFDDGSEVVCDSEHLWWTRTDRDGNEPSVKPISEVIRTLRTKKGQAHHRVPVAAPLDLPEADLPIDPYLLGCWLGDGAVRGGTITKQDDLFEILAADGHPLGVRQVDKRTGVITRTILGLHPMLEAVGLRYNKHIPAQYLRASYDQRLALLRGLMDTDGTWNTARNRAVFNSTDKELALAVEELVLSLGQRCSLSEFQSTGYGLTVTAYAVEWRPTGMMPFRLPRKVAKAVTVRGSVRSTRRLIVSVEPGSDVETACIAVDSPNHTYLCGKTMIPTHNTGSVEYGGGKMPQQVAVYARGQVYDPETGARTPQDLCTHRGAIINVPVGTGEGKAYVVDLVKGWEVVTTLSKAVRAHRNESKKYIWELTA